jgi:hypothetical protein
MMQRTSTVVFVAIVMAAAVAVAAAGQSVTMATTGNSLIVGSTLTAMASQAPEIELRTSYSIAGMLDIGFVYGLSLGAADEDQTTIGLSFAVAPVKQSPTVPVSIQIFGEYVHRSVGSEFLISNRLIQEGNGYGVGLIVARDFTLTSWLKLRAGGLTRFARHTETTSLSFVFDPDTFVGEPDVDYREYPLEDRLSSLVYGPYLALIAFSANGHTLGLSFSALFDEDGSISFRPGLQAAISR